MSEKPSSSHGHVREAVRDESVDAPERRRATDPSRSCIVQAPAGSGKTTLLVSRYLRLLSIVRQPEEILAITFTRKAAKEMRQRVLAELHANSSDEAQQANQVIEERKWGVLVSPQRLRIQTIDSFVFSLVKRLPYESQLSLDYEQIQKADSLYEEAVEEALDAVYRNDTLAKLLSKSMAILNNNHDQIVSLVVNMLSKREQWMSAVQRLASANGVEENLNQIQAGVREGREAFLDGFIDRFISIVSSGTQKQLKSFIVSVATLKEKKSLVPNSYEYWNYASQIFATKEGTYGKRHRLGDLGKGNEGATWRERWKTICDLLQQGDPSCTLGVLQKLPIHPLDDDVAEAIQSYAILLVMATTKLTELFRTRKVVDFAEMAIAARRALSSDNMPSEIALALDYRISHILVDEFQDTSCPQSELLNQLIDGWQENDGNTFFAVGDPMQSIYRFRYADLKNFLRAFRNGLQNRELERIRLVTNFRSSPILISWTNQLFAAIFGDTEDENTEQVPFTESRAANLNEGDYSLTICRSRSGTHEAQAVAEKIQQLKTSHKGETIAVLVRTRGKLHEYLDAFRNHEISWRGVEIAEMSNVEVVRDLYALTRTVVNSEDRLAWLSVLRSPLVGLELFELEQLAEYESLYDILELDVRDWRESAIAAIDRLRGPITEAYNSLHRSLRSRVERLWYLLGGNDAYASPDFPGDHLVQANRFLDVLEEFPSDSINVDELRTRIESAYASETLEDADVEVMTIHKAKGLEFDHVLIPDINGRGKPPQKELLHVEMANSRLLMSAKLPNDVDDIHNLTFDAEKQRDLNELKRLLYVGVTRARNTVSLFATVDPKHDRTESNSFFGLIPANMYKGEKYVEVRSFENETVLEKKNEQNVWKRLVSDYEFERPSTLPAYSPRSLIGIKEEEDLLDPIGKIPQTTIGVLVHSELQRMVASRDLNEPSSERVTRWRNEIRAQGYTDTDVNQILEVSQRQISQILGDKKGRWLLDPDHMESSTEIEFDTLENGEIEKIILDRTFVDEQGVRWIIDYKTTTLGMPDPSDIEELKLRHEGQLKRYANVIANIEKRPIKLALYLTDIAQFVPIAWDGLVESHT